MSRLSCTQLVLHLLGIEIPEVSILNWIAKSCLDTTKIFRNAAFPDALDGTDANAPEGRIIVISEEALVTRRVLTLPASNEFPIDTTIPLVTVLRATAVSTVLIAGILAHAACQTTVSNHCRIAFSHRRRLPLLPSPLNLTAEDNGLVLINLQSMKFQPRAQPRNAGTPKGISAYGKGTRTQW